MKNTNLNISIAALLFFSAIGLPVSAAQAVEPRISLVSTPESIHGLRADGTFVTSDRPGFRVTLLRNAGRSCGAEVNFSAVPWARALEMIRTSASDGAFAASFTEDRAQFAVFPMSSGKPDPVRAVRELTYSLYVNSSAKLLWDGSRLEVQPRRAVVERGSVGVALARKFNVEAIEVVGYENMIRMVAENRENVLIGIDANIQTVIRRDPRLQSGIKRVEPVFDQQVSYVMFSKQFHAKNTKLVECFWNAIGEIRKSQEYIDLVRSYNNGDFVE